MEKYKGISEELESIGHNFEEQKKRTQSYLYDIYNYKNIIIQEIKESSEKLGKQYFSISNVAEKIDCSRTTIYQNVILKEYVESINAELEAQNPYEQIQNLKEEMLYLNKVIDKMKVRDTEILLLKKENKDLKEQIAVNNENLISIIKK